MKKLIAILLVAVMCLSLVACGSGGNSASAEKAIIGEWKTLDGAITAFNEDGTGTTPDGRAFSWKYDTETEWYMMSLEGITFSCVIKNEDGIRSISIEGKVYYHTDSYEKAVEANK